VPHQNKLKHKELRLLRQQLLMTEHLLLQNLIKELNMLLMKKRVIIPG